MSETTLYTQCAEVLSLCQSLRDDLAALLDPETGFAPRLRQICRERLDDVEDPRRALAVEEVEALRMESDTWGLLQAVMPARKTAPAPLPTARSLLAENPYTPTSTLAQAIMNASALLSELVVVREWLQETAPQPQPPEAATGYWRYTKHRLAQAARTGNKKDVEGLVAHLDPDAASREEGKSLAGDDMAYEKSLAQALYLYVRAGRLEEAMEICRKAHQPWRSASIRGSLLFEWRAITTGALDTDDQDELEPDFEGWRGNRRRKLWKLTCTKAALNPAIPDQDRVLYAALAPSPQTSAVLKTACRTWEDHLWAQISVLCEEKQAAALVKLGGGFWEDEDEALDVPAEAAAEEDGWEVEVAGALAGLAGVGVDEGPRADHPFHISQLHIILDRTDALLDDFAEGLRTGRHSPASVDYPHMTRFFAHLCLFLRMIDVPVSPDAAQTILEAYLQVLELAGQRSLIALYAHALGDNAVQRYAQFLVSLELSADIEERRVALQRAEEQGLDVGMVAVVAAARTMGRALKILPPLKGPLPTPTAQTILAAPSPAELLFLRSLEWTTFRAATHGAALEQACVVLRYFLAAGRVHVAAHLLSTLPLELASLTEPEDLAVEYFWYRQFFEVRVSLERVVEFRAAEAQIVAGVVGKEGEVRWREGYKDALEQAREETVQLLTSDWLVVDGGDRRGKELKRIRRIYIPEFITRLHMMLAESRVLFPENLAHALGLANTVADSRYKLYEGFSDEDGKRLGEYLGVVRSAVVAGLEEGGSDVFRVCRGGHA
ncbi:hypothetical protein NEOLEDRAFT_1126698 [Neolentinus lepideus HHB14362 ss-1]|uniref:Nuclear pore complex protein n=1 Tax=Neolentinus lepideus HHB14362 ss-1 TaxID=1314782 RepID=A0A165VPK1_9AGAM|nr:hypothetical protein NEOLEDRAFT_1126698 [Neolentinus lepideus HHB14362 ss-1]